MIYTALIPAIERIKNWGEGALKNALITANTGFPNEYNTEYLFTNNINAVDSDNHFRKCDETSIESEIYNKKQAVCNKTIIDSKANNIKHQNIHIMQN